MTRQESFKRRIRTRMERTGERYGAARRVLIEQSADRPAGGAQPDDEPAPRTRRWAAEPTIGDAAVRQATGRGWEAWCDVLDAWAGRGGGHAAIAAHVGEGHGVDGWWAQTVAVGYERITGRRLPHQRPDGTFGAGKSRTVAADGEALREALLNQADRTELFPGLPTELRSRPTSKNVRLGIGPGVAEIALEPRDDGRLKITVQHERLPHPGEVETWKAYWAAWLDAVDGAGT